MIKLRGIKKTYQSGNLYIEALKDINLDIDKGEMIVIGGVSGSGKSTLLSLSFHPCLYPNLCLQHFDIEITRLVCFFNTPELDHMLLLVLRDNLTSKEGPI